jgi:hypothetical protein
MRKAVKKTSVRTCRHGDFVRLRESNVYEQELIDLAKSGVRFICACTEHGYDTEYEGFATKEEAEACAEQRRRQTFNGVPITAAHGVYELRQDTGGFWIRSFCAID